MAAPKVILYSTGLCGYCRAALRLLKSKGVAYYEIRVDKEPHRWQEMEGLSGRNTVPQIFIGEHHVGGFDDLSHADMAGELDVLLGLSSE